MNAIEKLKNRTEWQAYLLTIVTLFANHFLGWDLTADEIMAFVASTGLYGLSRGMAKKEG